MTLLEVVAAAIVLDGQVLAARRSRPVDLAGRWEFPGGKVEPGEDDRAALTRECREELGVEIEVGRQLVSASDERVTLALYAAVLDAGTPEPGDSHDELRWLTASTLASVDWLPIDAALLDPVRLLLRSPDARSTV
ncbi:(deoxy)nucleoside triphosphate pyrophosphohydrolase [uncultured Jatrophihabitans sp.]|uniref:(deoxy)nucleoside triphosphate pyrophosphohydrolase n=1 Tax=uncultured Jatrophihabitans sp. TaxID=1610747 RepID=UPI0035CBCDCC